jgi:hypothetical protein
LDPRVLVAIIPGTISEAMPRAVAGNPEPRVMMTSNDLFSVLSMKRLFAVLSGRRFAGEEEML